MIIVTQEYFLQQEVKLSYKLKVIKKDIYFICFTQRKEYYISSLYKTQKNINKLYNKVN